MLVGVFSWNILELKSDFIEKQNVRDFLRNSARPVGHQIRAADGWSVKVSAWVDAISTFIEFV